MAARFAQVIQRKKLKTIKEIASVPPKTKRATKYGLKIFQDKIFAAERQRGSTLFLTS